MTSPPKLVDQEADDLLPILGGHQLPGPDDLREHAAAFDVGDNHDAGPGVTRHSEVREVLFHQIDLDGASCAFEHDRFETAAQLVVSGRHAGPEPVLASVVFARRHDADGRPFDHDLRDPSGGLQQDRIHEGFGLDPRPLPPVRPGPGRFLRRLA